MLSSRTVFIPLIVGLFGCSVSHEVERLDAGSGLPLAQTSGTCTAQHVFERSLSVGHQRELYIEPVAVAASGQDVFLAGWPSYLHAWDTAERPRRLSTDSILGAVVGADGQGRTVSSPIQSRLVGTIRALARPSGGWDVVFAELYPYPAGRFPAPDTVAQLWHGFYDGSRWASLAQIPIPPGITLDRGGSSLLVRAGDTLTWAVGTISHVPRRVVVFERHADRWTSEIIPTSMPGSLALGHTPETGFLLAIPHFDSSATPGANPLLLYSRAPTWRRRQVIGSGEYAHSPTMTMLKGKATLTWYVEQADRSYVSAIDDPAHEPLRRSTVLDSSYASFRPVASASGANTTFWMIDHAAPLGRELRILRGTAAQAHEVARVPSPFLGGFDATAVGDSDVFVAGAALKDSIPVSHLIRKRVLCIS